MKKIKILGTGCRKCQELAENAEAAAKNLGIDYQLEKVTDLNDIVAHGVMMTPAIVIDDQVRASGKVLSPEDIEKMLG
ncbi:MAG: thioredoxin family protein [Deltaproteobacteria bacterium]|nr:MAG: thioredoxin family protein [Deltaproteobacteria bacterium]